MELDIENAQVAILLESNNKIYMVGMDKERLEAITMLIKKATGYAIPTNKTQEQLLDFLGYTRR
ncbi:hypothetical protein SAMN05421839_10210 [Halolactibacillus halophilus]|uniref:Uncharacterized protein n=1 Tax=Halolactibacillus halophilus TaxID=306540 RepID=A0A1I5LD16_9BACI|nr:hypothetical protein [Halolactibacillus halophilus]GEM00882.1 hypothetical protein HHA03_04140 [Halolactibacillus halophilus]SFO95127.1 hypothetical protein SAMN05421839_10210 [Halolactibacillus halophilus]